MSVSKPTNWKKEVMSYVVDLRKKPPPTQLAISAGVGSVSGYFLAKSGRVVSATVGMSFLILQFAIHKGYISVDESKIQKDINNLKKSISKQSNSVPKLSNSFLADNRWILGGFAAGMLIGCSFG